MEDDASPMRIPRVPTEEDFRRRHGKSIDQLSPDWYAPARRLGKPSAVFSLTSTIVGGGVLSLPFAFLQTGLVMGPILLAVCAAISDFSIYLLVLCARATGAESYQQVACNAFGPRAKMVTTSLLFLLTWLCCVAYIILMGDMLTPLVDLLLDVNIQKGSGAHSLVLILVTSLVSPLGLLKTLHALRFTSMLCVFSVALLACCIAWRSAHEGQVIGHGVAVSREMLPDG